MPNPHRGEIEASLDGKPFALCLTLGALAELEAAFGDDDMLGLAQRFGHGRLSARDAVRIIGAGLRGAGNQVTDEAVARMQCDDGAAGFVDIVARLLAATFGGAADGGMAKAHDRTSSPAAEAHAAPAPFPGAT